MFLILVRTIIPLNQVISIRPCYCKNSKHLTCDCFGDKSSISTEALTSVPSTSSEHIQYNNSQLAAVRIYYAVAVGEHRWKVTFIPLNIQNNDTENETDYSKLFEWINGVSSLLEGECVCSPCLRLCHLCKYRCVRKPAQNLQSNSN